MGYATDWQRKQLVRHLKGLRVRIMYTRGASKDAPLNSPARRTRTIAGIRFEKATEVKFKK